MRIVGQPGKIVECLLTPSDRWVAIAMRFVAATIIVLLGFCSITAVQAEQSNSCKQCHEEQQACAKNYSAKTCKTEYDICMKGCQKK